MAFKMRKIVFFPENLKSDQVVGSGYPKHLTSI